jgi:hypothetical protein
LHKKDGHGPEGNDIEDPKTSTREDLAGYGPASRGKQMSRLTLEQTYISISRTQFQRRTTAVHFPADA